MSKREEIERHLECLIEPVLVENSFDLWDIEYVKEGKDYYLRAYIDKEGGITIDDCVTVSRYLSDKLDEDDFMGETPYILEVSSPGLGRKLVKDKEFERSIGKEIDIKFYKPINGVKELSAVLEGFTKSELSVDVEGKKEVYSRSDIAMVKLSLDL